MHHRHRGVGPIAGSRRRARLQDRPARTGRLGSTSATTSERATREKAPRCSPDPHRAPGPARTNGRRRPPTTRRRRSRRPRKRIGRPIHSALRMKTTVEPLEGNKVKLSVEVDERRVRAGDRRRVPQARPARCASRASGPARRPAGCSRPASAPRSAASRRSATRCPSTTPRRSSRARRRRDRRRPRSRSPRARRTATSSSTPSSRCGPVVDVDGYDELRVELDRARAVDDEAVDARSTRLRERFADLEDVDRAARRRRLRRRSTSRATSTARRSTGLTADRLPLRGRLRHASSPELDEELRGAKARRHPRVQRRRCPSASASAPATRSPFQVLVKEVKQKVLPELTDEWVERGSASSTPSTSCATTSRDRIDDVAQGAGADGAARARCSRRSPSSSTDEVPEPLVDAGDGAAPPRPRAPARRRRASTLEQYLAATGQDPGAVRRRAAAERDRGGQGRPRAAGRRRRRGDRGRPTTRSTPRSSGWPSGWARSPTEVRKRSRTRRQVLEAVRSDISTRQGARVPRRARDGRRRGRATRSISTCPSREPPTTTDDRRPTQPTSTHEPRAAEEPRA